MNHTDQLTRMNRIAGQVAGITRMIESERYCLDIVLQLRAVRAALKKVEGNILQRHMQHCVSEALGSSPEAQKKLEELQKLFEAEKD